MQLALITSEQDKPGEKELVNSMFLAGLNRLHLRKPGYSNRDYEAYFNSVDRNYHNRIILHGGGFELYGKIETGGVHINTAQRSDIKVLDAIVNIPPSQLSSSFHSWREIRHCQLNLGYVFISPVFDSISKSDYKAGVNLSGLATLKSRFAEQGKTCPGIFGLGGIDVPHVAILKQYKFDGAVVYGSVWKSANPLAMFEGLLAAAQK